MKPVFVLVVAWAAVWSVSRGWRTGRTQEGAGGVLAAAVGVTVLAAYCATVVWYATRIEYMDPAEPTITAVAAVFNAGAPLYPALDAPERYALIYGPVLFLTHAAALAAVGPSILASKAVGATAVLASLVLVFLVCRKDAGTATALLAAAACALVYMGFGNVSFWTRSDPLLILCAAAALFAARARRWLPAAVLLGVVLGAAVNLKLTGPLYLLPAYGLALAGHGSRAVLLGAVVAMPVAVAPFLLPHVSFAHYREYFELAARNGLMAAIFRQTLGWSVFLCAPLALGLWTRRRNTGEPIALIAASVLVAFGIVSLAAAKPGGGPFHLLPFVPFLAYAVVRFSGDGLGHPAIRSLLLAFGVTATLFAVPKQATFIRTVRSRDLGPAVADARRFADQHRRRGVAVGYAGTSYLSHARTEAVFRTGDYLIDAPAVQEHRLSGLPLPSSTMNAIDDCRIGYWLIPADGEPFLVPSAYFPYGPPDVFPAEFRAAFLDRHVRTTRIGPFDVWECRTRKTPMAMR